MHISNQTRIYSLNPEARNRLNTVYMVTGFLGGALGSYLGTWGWSLAGWNGVCGVGTLMLVAALTVFAINSKRTWGKRRKRSIIGDKLCNSQRSPKRDELGREKLDRP